jgi:hypothetical protein
VARAKRLAWGTIQRPTFCNPCTKFTITLIGMVVASARVGQVARDRCAARHHDRGPRVVVQHWFDELQARVPAAARRE